MVAQQKLPQILQLTPSSEIVFQGPFEHVVTSYLELKNPSDKPVGFKVKTTAPRRYCVRPNSGVVDPGQKIKIAIMLQPMDAESQAERNKHKFMVQSTVLEQPLEHLDEVWMGTDQIMDSKLRCVFQEPDQEQQDSSPTKKAADLVPDTAAGKSVTTPASATTSSTTASQHQSEQPARSNKTLGDGRPNLAEPTTSTPVGSRVTSSTSRPNVPYGATSSSTSLGAAGANQISKRSVESGEHVRSADKSVASSHNLTSSFLHPMSDDYESVLVSLAMWVLGVILGKYII